MLCEDVQRRRWWQAWGVWLFAGAIIAALVAGVLYGLAAARPTRPSLPASTSAPLVVVNSAIIVFREGLEAILIFAAVTAAMLGANRRAPPPRRCRRPGSHSSPALATWFGAQAILAQFLRPTATSSRQ